MEVERVPPAARGELLQRTVAALGRRHVGAVAGILDLADGQLLISGTGSLRAINGSAPDADTTFEIGSITKTFTASALAHAVVTGRLSLDTPVRDILPAGTSVPVRDAVEITVEHLARHTSGLPRSPQRLGPRAIWAAGARGEDPYAPINTHVLLEQLSQTRLRPTPGKGRIRYSNFGAAVLGLALTQVHGKATYHEMIEDVVLHPLGLTATTAEGKTEAEGHAFRRRPAPNWHLDGLAGAGALRSTASDLLRYLRAQLRPDQTPCRGNSADPCTTRAGSPYDHRPGLDAQPEPRQPDVLAQQRHRRISQLRGGSFPTVAWPRSCWPTTSEVSIGRRCGCCR